MLKLFIQLIIIMLCHKIQINTLSNTLFIDGIIIKSLLSSHIIICHQKIIIYLRYISKAIGPQDIIEILLNNLRVQERQNRICITVAIAIVAEQCSPFTVLAHLLNEYRVPELNVQNGILKSLSFLFEYIHNESSNYLYIYPILSLLQDALSDRDLVHRQTACSCIKHLSLGLISHYNHFGSIQDALQHLLNYVWPNIFEHNNDEINSNEDEHHVALPIKVSTPRGELQHDPETQMLMSHVSV